MTLIGVRKAKYAFRIVEEGMHVDCEGFQHWVAVELVEAGHYDWQVDALRENIDLSRRLPPHSDILKRICASACRDQENGSYPRAFLVQQKMYTNLKRIISGIGLPS